MATEPRGTRIENVDFYGSKRRVTKSVEVFGRDLIDIGKDVASARALKLLTKQVSLRLFNEISRNTPVATGYARANWVVDEVPTVTPVPQTPEEGKTYPLPEVPKLSNALTYYIKNGLRYIPSLEAGSSNQKPTGFIANALFFVAKQLRNSKK